MHKDENGIIPVRHTEWYTPADNILIQVFSTGSVTLVGTSTRSSDPESQPSCPSSLQPKLYSCPESVQIRPKSNHHANK